ncbi:MAG: penicillin-insensitive murein endopeptidase [Polyangiaceae bacterium]|nr:penicillin-insensitive murein endopeptidase [Polyangiaceae bacterium]
MASRSPCSSLLALALVLAPCVANAAPPRASVAARVISAKSIGSPTNGKLVGGARLDTSDALRVYPDDAPGDVRWGLPSLVGMIERSAHAVRKQFPDAVLSVGHLSKAGGGEIDRHASHESGRDADLGFYVKNIAGKQVYADHMVSFKGDGTAPTWPGARFDDARNWALVSAMLNDASARITHIFVATPIRERLLAYAVKIGAPAAIRTRASELLAQPRGALPHDDHFHVRIACPSRMDACIEQPIAKVAKGRGRSAPQANRSARSAPAASSRSAPKPVPPRTDREENARNDSIIPSLAPAVPGLDSVVIPAPLAGMRATWGAPTKQSPTAPAPSSDPVDDPDGVLENR